MHGFHSRAEAALMNPYCIIAQLQKTQRKTLTAAVWMRKAAELTAKNADGSGLDAEGGGTYHCAIYNSILYNNSPADTWASI